MHYDLKQRLVGAAVLLAVVVVIIPFLLSEADHELTATNTPTVSPRPASSTAQQTIPISDLDPATGRHALSPVASLPPSVPSNASNTPLPSPSMLGPHVPMPNSVMPRTGEPQTTEHRGYAKLAVPTVATKRTGKLAATSLPGPAASGTPVDRHARLVQPTVPRRGTWLVQVGLFDDERNARQLVKKISHSGFSAHVDTLRGDAKIKYRVGVGPEPTWERAQQLKARIAAVLGLQGIIHEARR